MAWKGLFFLTPPNTQKTDKGMYARRRLVNGCYGTVDKGEGSNSDWISLEWLLVLELAR